MQEYDIKEKVRRLLDEKGKRLVWLVAKIERTESWFQKLESIDKIPFKVLLDMSDALEFDFVFDYYKHTNRRTPAPMHVVNEPDVQYNDTNTGEVQITIKGSTDDLKAQLERLVHAIKS